MLTESFSISVISANEQSKVQETLNEPPIKKLNDEVSSTIVTREDIDENGTIVTVTVKDFIESPVKVGSKLRDKNKPTFLAPLKPISFTFNPLKGIKTIATVTGKDITKNDTIEIVTWKDIDENGTFKIPTGKYIDKNGTTEIVTAKDIDENGTFEVLTGTDIDENDTIAIVTEKYDGEIETTTVVKEEHIDNIATDNVAIISGDPEKQESPFIPTDPYNFKFLTKRPIKPKIPNVTPLSVKNEKPTNQDTDFENTEKSKSIIKGYFQIISEPLVSNDYSKKPDDYRTKFQRENQTSLDYPNDPSPLSIVRKSVEGKDDLHNYPLNASNEMLQISHFKWKKSLIPHKPEDASKIYKVLDHAANKKYQELKKQTMEDQIIAELKNKQHSKTRHKDSFHHDEQPLPM
ncbi:hypothetical protein TNCT_466611 [Trichonephila clavata]|uniref:Uncharacterized protein n=1 Tax=Trichonephila clavata TaxID=2740835 RepID=A0A8X6L4K6_TRICU|nr:hypothetical protein TNCT_466611 [Trichonephila clavata]